VCLFWAPVAVGGAVRIQVQIEGIEGDLLENVKAYLGILRHREREGLDEADIRRYHRRAKSEIAQALQPFGYYRPRVESRLETTEEGWLARYRIDPGERMRVAQIAISVTGPGAGDEGLREAVSAFPLREGDPLRHAAW